MVVCGSEKMFGMKKRVVGILLQFLDEARQFMLFGFGETSYIFKKSIVIDNLKHSLYFSS